MTSRIEWSERHSATGEAAPPSVAHIAESARGLFVLADSVGWRARSSGASRVAVRAVRRALSEAPTLGRGQLERALSEANEAVLEILGGEPSSKTESVSVMALAIDGPRAVVAHAGNCRCYRARHGTLERLTRDHTALGEMGTPFASAEGLDAFQLHHLNVLTEALGRGPELHPEVVSADVRAGDRFLLCSAEVWSRIPDRRLVEAIARPADARGACAELAATLGSASDDWCILVADSEGVDDAAPERRA